MQELIAEMHRAKMNEYKRMREAHGEAFYSTHEAWAVTKEEVDEAIDDMHDVMESLQEAWSFTRADVNPATAYQNIEKVALSAAAECIQIAACAYKALRSEGVVGGAEIEEDT